MKRIQTLCVAMAMALALSACGGKPAANAETLLGDYLGAGNGYETIAVSKSGEALVADIQTAGANFYAKTPVEASTYTTEPFAPKDLQMVQEGLYRLKTTAGETSWELYFDEVDPSKKANILLAVPYQAEGEDFPYVVNDQIVFASKEKAVEVEADIVYAPLELFLEALGATYITDNGAKTVTVFQGNKILSFQIETGEVVTYDGRVAAGKSYFRGEICYVPVELLAKELGGSFALLANDVLRVTDGEARISDEVMEAMLEVVGS